MDKPTALPNPDFTELIKLCQSHIDDMEGDDYNSDNDDKEYIYEAAIEAVFGKNVWPWINAQVDRSDDDRS